MSHILTCDLYHQPMLQEFGEPIYKVSVRRLRQAYDGYAPFIRKQRLDVCGNCVNKIATIAQPYQENK